MKQVSYRALDRGERFYQDHQWWVKLDDKSARHASLAMSIDMRPGSNVLVRGEETAPAGAEPDGRQQMRKREGFFVLLGTLFESFHWFG